MKQKKVRLYILVQLIMALFFTFLSTRPRVCCADYGHNAAEEPPLMHESESGKQMDVEHDTSHAAGLSHADDHGDAEHDTPHAAGEDHQEAVPLIYLLYWGILILVMVIILVYFVVRYKRGQNSPLMSLALLLVFFVLTAHLIEITPIFSGRLDPATLEFVSEFHESPNLGFLRFLYKFLLGVFLTFFAFLNIDNKKFSAEEGKIGQVPVQKRRAIKRKKDKQGLSPLKNKRS